MSGYETSFADGEEEVNATGDFQHPGDDEVREEQPDADTPEAVKDAKARKEEA